MKKFFAITLLLIMLVITQENACEGYADLTACENNGDEKLCLFDSEGSSCHEIVNKGEYCEYNTENHQCSKKDGVEEDVTKLCKLGNLSEDPVPCESVEAQCHDYDSEQNKCLLLENCGYETDNCFSVTLDSGCQFSSDGNHCSIESNAKICELKPAEPAQEKNKHCVKRDIQCSDLNSDSDKCKQAVFQDATKKCYYDSSQCVEVSIESGCTFNNDDKQCTGEYLSEGKTCALDETSPAACKKRNIECNEFDGNKNKCESAKLLHKNIECIYNEQNQCVEKSECEFKSDADEKCVSKSPSKIKCTLNSGENGCDERAVLCSDFESDEAGCKAAIITTPGKKCFYDSTKASNKCYDDTWTCENTSTDQCESFTPSDTNKQCSLNKDTNKCEETSKAETKSETKTESKSNGATSLKLLLSIISLLVIF